VRARSSPRASEREKRSEESGDQSSENSAAAWSCVKSFLAIFTFDAFKFPPKVMRLLAIILIVSSLCGFSIAKKEIIIGAYEIREKISFLSPPALLSHRGGQAKRENFFSTRYFWKIAREKNILLLSHISRLSLSRRSCFIASRHGTLILSLFFFAFFAHS
jgi:hypothetical protein